MINWHFVSHIIRDVFDKPITPAVLTDDASCMFDFRSSEHSLGFIGVSLDGFRNTEPRFPIQEQIYFDWDIYNPRYILGVDHSDFLISIDYSPRVDYKMISLNNLANVLMSFIQNKKPIVLINPGLWADGLNKLPRIPELENELKRFSLFDNKEVIVYENL